MVAVGSSVATNANDGLNCMAAESPFPDPITTDPWDCTEGNALRSPPLQMIADETTNVASLKALEISSGTYTTMFEIPKSWIEAKYSSINACGINPVDSIIYCSIGFAKVGYYLCRIDRNDIAVVAKLPNTDFFASGTFGSDGTYYIANNNAETKEAWLYTLKGVHELDGYSEVTAPVANFSTA